MNNPDTLTKRSSLLDRTRNATLGRLGKRTSVSIAPPQPKVTRPAYTSIYDEIENDEADDLAPKPPRLTSEYFKRYEVLTEFANLRNPKHCPLGVYMMPSEHHLYVWYGVIFIHKGFYRSGAFKFKIELPENYPNAPPTVSFLTEMFHPLVNIDGKLSIAQQFPVWRPYQDYTYHVLHYIKNIFKKAVLDSLNDKYCYNKEAYRLYRTEMAIFGKMAQQCAQLSITESFLFERMPEDNLIRFSPLTDAKFGKTNKEDHHITKSYQPLFYLYVDEMKADMLRTIRVK
ncbi:Protein crossbronx [Choanephora cucurbitarum]|uniref:Protein crossbronx n=1 Tax=Choanephora cucurbitarum TaxID=101091 RepID=A0A1C7NB04_9FUNG|nr:Protein crossbronx [Choanephora cucurbitarum]